MCEFIRTRLLHEYEAKQKQKHSWIFIREEQVEMRELHFSAILIAKQVIIHQIVVFCALLFLKS